MAAAGAGAGSYYEEYMRSNALLKHGHEKNAKKILTDRNAYISFLEVQLERVSAACLTTQSFDKRLAELESVQSMQDQKLGSLSKVFRLNQEYMEQIAEQSRSDVAGLDAKWSAWMDKYSHEVHSQQTRMDATEEQLRQCEDFLQRLAEQMQNELKDVKSGTQQELEDLKTIVFTLETRLESMQSSTLDTDKHLEFLKDLVTDRFDKELEIVRTSVSEKWFTMEGKLKRLSEVVDQIPEQLETNWKADLIRVRNVQQETATKLYEKMEVAHEQQTRNHMELKEVLRKCLDTQHLLSSTVVAVQNEVDEQKQAQAPEVAQVSSAIDDLRENQHKLKDALRMIQMCTQNAQQESEENCSKLADRLHTAEETFSRLAEDSLGRADGLRTKMLIALGEVEQKLRHDADFVAEQAVKSVRVESECQFKQMMEFTSAIENRLRILERGVLSLEAKQQRSQIVSGVMDEAVDKPNTAEKRTNYQNPQWAYELQKQDTTDHQNSTLMDTMEEKMRSVVSHIRDGMHLEQGQRELLLQDKIMELEERLHRKAQSEEERRVLLPNQHRAFLMKPPSSSAALSSESSSSCIRQRNSVTTKTGNSDHILKRSVKPESATKKVVKEKALARKKPSKEVRPQTTSRLSSSAAKSKALKEVSGPQTAF